MLSGFNTNFRHRGVLFHVQTEDSGIENPHVITHLFHGGNILASQKREYADKVGSDDLESSVRTLMEEQHRSMLRQLSSGHHDPIILDRLGPEVFDESADTAATLPPAEPLPKTPPRAAPRAKQTDGMAPPSESPKERIARAFGEGVVSQKPLDEVVLDYLVENARKRKRPPK